MESLGKSSEQISVGIHAETSGIILKKSRSNWKSNCLKNYRKKNPWKVSKQNTEKS